MSQALESSTEIHLVDVPNNKLCIQLKQI